MSLYDVDWSQFLSKDSEIRPDVEFRVIEICDGKEDKTAVVKAHKLLLSGVSEVFRKQFYGPMKEEEGVIDVKETTIEAFTTMMNFFYSKSENFSISNIKDPEALFELLNVANKYLITGLVDAVEMVIKNLELSMDNVILAANAAQAYGHFEEASTSLTHNCARYLDRTFQTKDDMYAFFLSIHTNSPGSDSELIMSLLRLNAACPNCKMKLTDCLHGTDVITATVGLKVCCKKTGAYKAFHHYGEASIRQTSPGRDRKKGLGQKEYSGPTLQLDFKKNQSVPLRPVDDQFQYYLRSGINDNFVFHCKNQNKEDAKKVNSSKGGLESPAISSFTPISSSGSPFAGNGPIAIDSFAAISGSNTPVAGVGAAAFVTVTASFNYGATTFAPATASFNFGSEAPASSFTAPTFRGFGTKPI